jgi:hypothetical protein
VSFNDRDHLDRLLERRADMLDTATGLLLAVIFLRRSFTAEEEDAWTWAMSMADEIAAQCAELMECMRRRRQLRRKHPVT